MRLSSRHFFAVGVGLILIVAAVLIFSDLFQNRPDDIGANDFPDSQSLPNRLNDNGRIPSGLAIRYQPRQPVDASGFSTIMQKVKPWSKGASLDQVRAAWLKPGEDARREFDQILASNPPTGEQYVALRVMQAGLMNYDGEAKGAYDLLTGTRTHVEENSPLLQPCLYTVVYLQGLCALRRGENENCIMCRGESSCILPISPAAVHVNPAGSRKAIEHFTEYLKQFPDDLEVKYLLNIAHMTLGEYPTGVDPKHVLLFEPWLKSEFDIGKFRDVGHLVGVNRFNQAGGGILDDFDNDGLPDLIVSTFDPVQAMAVYKNQGNGLFLDISEKAGVEGQVGGGLYCVQADYNNDGRLDVFIPRGAWIRTAVRPSLLRNDGEGRFTDVTEEAGLSAAVNSNAAAWGDFDNDGLLDLYVCCERQPCRLYRNLGNGAFEDEAEQAGVEQNEMVFCKGATWIDIDNDDDLDLFVNNLEGAGKLFQNDGKGKFTDASQKFGINGPQIGFSCWAWDYDNDGWLDLFATSYDRTLNDVVLGLIGKPHSRQSSRLFHNQQGQGFHDVTKQAGLDAVFATMGSNYGDFDNDGFLDFYLGTGDPNISTLVPNRMFKNVGGQRFAEITSSSGTGHLQKGHAVSCADWDRDGDLDIFIQMGGAIPGDRYHNVLFQNPGQGNHWLSVKLVGKKTNRSALGARIRLVTAQEQPLVVHRHVSSGSSFGANSLEQHIGLGQAKQVATLEVHWPTSGTTQVFHDLAADQAIEITEFAEDYKKLDYKPIPLPKEMP